MALKTLMYRKKIEGKREQLKTMKMREEEFSKREQDLEQAIEEAQTEEEKSTVEEEVDKYEKEKNEYDKAKEELEKEVADLEEELAKMEKEQQAPVRQENVVEEREVNGRMNTREFFGMNMQERTAFFENDKVKDFLGEVRTCIKEKRAIANVGLTIPDVMLPLLKTKVEETSKLMKRVSLRPVPGQARQRIMGTIPEAVWTEMCSKLNELDLSFNDTEVDGYKVGGFFAVCNAVLEDNDVNLAAEIINALGKSIGKALDKAILYGTGTKMPLGIVTRLAQTQKPSNYPDTEREWKDLRATNIKAGSGAIGLKLFQEIVGNTKSIINDYFESDIIFCMNKATHMELIIQSMEKNLNAAIVAGIKNEMPVIGGDILEFSFIPEGDIIFGYPDAYLLAERAGTVLGQSEHVRFLEDQTVFKGTARYDGKPVIPEAFGLMSIAKKEAATSVEFKPDAANSVADPDTGDAD